MNVPANPSLVPVPRDPRAFPAAPACRNQPATRANPCAACGEGFCSAWLGRPVIYDYNRLDALVAELQRRQRAARGA